MEEKEPDKPRRKKRSIRRQTIDRLKDIKLQSQSDDDYSSGGWSIRNRLYALIGATCILITTLAGIAIYGFMQSYVNSTTVIDNGVMPLTHLSNIKSYISENQIQILNARNNPITYQINLSSDNIERNNVAIKQLWDVFSDSLTKTPQEQIIISDLKHNLSRYQVGSQVFLDSLRRQSLFKTERDSQAVRDMLAQSNRITEGILTERELENVFSKVLVGAYSDINKQLSELIKLRIDGTGKRVDDVRKNYYSWVSGIVIMVLIGVVLIIIISLLMANRVRFALKNIKTSIQTLSQGDLAKRRLEETDDEFGELAGGMNKLTMSLRKISAFANEIGEGKFDSTFEPFGETDELGTSIVTMRDKLQLIAEEDKKRNWSIAGFAQMGEILRMAEDLQGLADKIVSALTKYIDANQGAFFLINDEDSNDIFLTMTATYAYNKKKFIKREFRLGEGFVGQSAVEKDVIYISDIPTDYVTMTSGLGEAIPKALLIVPLIYNDVVYGVVEFASFSKFKDYEVEFVKKLSENIGAALANLQGKNKTLILLKESQTLSEELKGKQEALLENTKNLEVAQVEMFKAQIELRGQIGALNNAAIVSETDLEGNIIFVNDKFTMMSKFSRDDLMGQNHKILKSGQHNSESYTEMWNTISAGKVWKGELKNKTRDGLFYWVEASISPVLDEKGKVVKYISVQFDVTAQKIYEEQIRAALEESMAQEEELRQNAEEMEAATEEMRRTQIELTGQINALNHSAIVSETDLQGRIISVNEQFLKMSKFTREELIGQNHRLLKSGHQEDDIFEALWRTITKGEVWKGEFKNRGKDGSHYWVTATITPVLDSDRKPIKYIGVTFDITAQKLQEEQIRAALEISQAQEQELRQNSEELQAAQEEMRKTQIELRGQIGALNNAGLVTETDLRGNITMVNEEFCKLSGYSREELLSQNNRILKSDEKSDDFYIHLWSTITHGKVWTGVFKNRTKNGNYYWLKSTITPVLGLDGKPLKYIGVSFDITAQVLQEEKITEALEISQKQEIELRLNAGLLQAQQIELNARMDALNNSGIVTESDLDGKITFVNEEGIKTWEFSRAELIGNNYRMLKSDTHDEAFYTEMWQTISAGKVWKNEIKNRIKDGYDQWSLLTITPVLDLNGKPIKYIAVAYDITRQKRQASRIKAFLEISKKQEDQLRQNAKDLQLAQTEIQKAQLELNGQIKAVNNAAIVSESNLEGNIIFVNDEAKYVWGYTREEVIGQNHKLIKSDEHSDEFFQKMWHNLSNGINWIGDVKNKAKDGSEFWIKLTITPVLDENGKVYKYIGVSFDITSQKIQANRIKQALKQSEHQEEQFKLQIDSLQQQLNETHTITKEIEKIIEVPVEKFIEVEKIVERIIEIQVEKIVEVEKIIEVEKIKEIQIEALNNFTSEEWKTLNSFAAISETDRRGIINNVNDIFLKMTGYSREELLGQDHKLIKSNDTHSGTFLEMWAIIGRGKIWTGELKNKRKDGTFYWVNLHILPVLDDNQKPTKYIAIAFDITAEKQRIEKIGNYVTKPTEKVDETKVIELNSQIHELNRKIQNIQLKNETEIKKIKYEYQSEFASKQQEITDLKSELSNLIVKPVMVEQIDNTSPENYEI